MEIATGIHRIEAPLGERTNAVYLLAGEKAGLLIDTTIDDTASEYIGGYLSEIDYDPEQIRFVLNTHSDWDHMAGNGTVREMAPDAAFLCHELDLKMIEDIESMIRDRYGEFESDHGIGETDEAKDAIRSGTRTVPIDIALQGGESIDLGNWRVDVVHTPGHTWGSVSVLDRRSGTAIIGDAVLGEAVPLSDGSPAFPPTYRYRDTYLSTIHFLQQFGADRLLASHWPVMEGSEVGDFLARSRAFVHRLDTFLEQALREAKSPMAMTEIIASTARVGAWPEEANSALAFPLLGHLEALEQRHQVEVVLEAGVAKYGWRT